MAYKVPFVDLPKHYQRLEGELMPVIRDVLFKRADLIMRGDLAKFEENVAKFVGVKYAVGLNSGTDTLYLSLLACGIGKGDEVVTVSHTFVATIAAIKFTGAMPVLIDVGRDHNMDVDQLEKAITRRTKAIMPVHLNGRVCDMYKIMKIAKKHKLVVIEDAAQALGGKFNGKMAGSFGITGSFSLYPMKILGGTGDGGIVVTNNKRIADKIRLMRDHSQNRKTGEILNYGFNSRLDNFHAAILDVKLKHLSKWIERRREIAQIYYNGLNGLEQVTVPPSIDEDTRYYDAFQNYVIMAKRRNALVKYLKEQGIETLISWPKPTHKHKGLGLQRFKLPMTEKISREVVSLPMNTEVTNKQLSYVINTIKTFYNKKG
ncbi:dTDP-3-amino-3,6-dideoxy-alpha-D-galactopyranose transaminase [subsurface metagenome]